MDSVEYVLEYMEGGNRKPDGPDRLYDVVDKLQDHNPKFYMDVWQGVKEFQRAKLMRSNNIPVEAQAEDDKNVYVSINNGETHQQVDGNNRHPNISEGT